MLLTMPAKAGMTFLDHIDFCFLSKLRITGSNVKDIALAALFSATKFGNIKIERIMKAIKRELRNGAFCYQKK
jgi:hypothetical protein